MMENRESIITLIQSSIQKNWEYPALSDLHGASYQYRDVARKIAKLHLLFEHAGLKPGDKIALCGRNCAQWAMAFLASFTYGTVSVPILHEFKPDNIHNLVTHSDAKLLFVDTSIWENLEPDAMPALKGALNIADYSVILSRSKRLTEARNNLNRLFGERYPERFVPSDAVYRQPADDNDMAIINYTSGSTGFSKGVVLSYHNLWSNVRFALDNIPYIKPGDGAICMLPLAHMFGLTIEMLHMLAHGAHIYFLTRTPSPRIIMDAFATVRPKLIITVPLIIEKIIKGRVFPLLDKPLMKVLLHIPVVDDRLLGKIRDKLTATFGGNLEQLIIGGAALNKDVETFLRRIHFPFTVGYGMTECAPLIAYAPWDAQRPGSCGRITDRMEARIDSPDPANIPGTLWVRGDNVMKGYYKNPKATAEALTPDGWLNTGDLCTRDADGYLYIRGRDKNMILGPSGQNIYPEEIEAKLNNLPLVGESIVLDRNGRIIALVHPNYEQGRIEGLTDQQTEKRVMDQLPVLNKELPGYSRVSAFEIHTDEFAKTPKHSIRRFLYK